MIVMNEDSSPAQKRAYFSYHVLHNVGNFHAGYMCKKTP